MVGLLLAAFYQPVWTSAIDAPGDVVLGLVDLALLSFWTWPSWVVVFLSAMGGACLARLQHDRFAVVQVRDQSAFSALCLRALR